MSLSFSIQAKPQSKLQKRPSADKPPSAAASKNFVTQFTSSDDQAQVQVHDSAPKPIPPIPNNWRPNKKLKNLQSLPSISQPNGEDAAPQFELDPASIAEAEAPADGSMTYGLNLRQSGSGSNGNRAESIAELELRKLREDLDNLPDDTGMEEFEDVPVEGFGAALLLGYGWKEGSGIGRNAKEDVKITEVTRKAGRGGLGFTGDMPEEKVSSNGNAGDGRKDAGKKKGEDRVLKKDSRVGKEVMIVHGRDMGVKGKVVDVRSDGDMLVLRLKGDDHKVKVRSRDVLEVGSSEEVKFSRKLKEMRNMEKVFGSKDRRERGSSSKTSVEKERPRSKRGNWLRNNIRVRVVSEQLKGGRLFLEKGMVVDVVGPGVCDISMDETKELIQGVDQEWLETALPKRGGPVLVLSGKHKGVYGNLMERDTEKEKGVVRDADTHELLSLKLDEVAEFVGDPSEIGY